ncbi:hypothetical protein AB0I82_06700 [Streptomyces sp. NPDC050315]|uniref:hypothetical protein n=1 Tax=Streptomyces sp. NPDC050315 TaxID=3155039 RepID=UPI003434DD64
MFALRPHVQGALLDGGTRFANDGLHRRMRIGRPAREVDDAFDAPAERVVDRSGEACERLQALGEVLLPMDVAGFSFGKRGAHAIGARDPFRVREARGELHRVEVSVEGPFPSAPVEHSPFPVREENAQPGVHQHRLQPSEHGHGRAEET